MVIGLGGYAQSGKDTLFDLLNKYGRKEYKRFAFADELKLEIKPLIFEKFGFDIFDCSPEQKASVRHLMVELGAGKRAENPNYWMEKLFANIAKDKIIKGNGPRYTYVITDVRYSNEVNWIKEKYKNNAIVVLNRFGNVAANKEEEEHTSVLYSRSDVIQFSWSDLKNYSEEDLKEITLALESQIFEHENNNHSGNN